MDLISRRNKIKSAIIMSNAKTVVEVAGKQMTVAEAIDKKSSIEYEKELLIHEEGQLYKIVKFEVNGADAYMAAIFDPSKVKLEALKPLS